MYGKLYNMNPFIIKKIKQTTYLIFVNLFEKEL
jgi:hypothetical protein